MVEHRMTAIDLITVKHDNSGLDDTDVKTYTPVLCHLTELNGAQAQLNVFGEQHKHSYVARIQGYQNADYVRLSGDKTEYEVNQLRRHAIRTDIYFSKDKVTSNGMGQ